MQQVDEGVGQDGTEDKGVERRRFLRRGAITAAVAAAGAAAIASPAGAADNDSILIGSANNVHNTGTTTTTLTGSQFVAKNGNGNLSLVGQSDADQVNTAIGIEARAASGTQLRLAPNTLDLLANPPTDGHSFAAGSLVTDKDAVLWYAYEDGAGVDIGLHPISLTAAMLPITPPKRQYDSRNGGGPLNGNVGQQRTIPVINPALASTVVAFSCNLTVVDTTGSGFLALWSGTPVWNPAQPFSSINWFTAGQITANCVIATADPNNGTIVVRAGGTGTTDFIVDLTGVWVI